MSELLDDVLEAHGGRERWRAARELKASVRSGGLLLATRVERAAFAAYEITVRLREPWVAFRWPDRSEQAIFHSGAVRFERDGEVIESRERPRELFFGRPGLRRNLRWDRLDITYFAGYAMWNYLTTPWLLTRQEVRCSEGEPWTAPNGATWRRLEATFAPAVDTHSRSQVFYVGPDGLLRRHDYKAEVVGGWANASHALARHREFAGLVFPTERRVTPRGPGNRALAFPTLVWIEIAGIEVGSG